VSKVDWMGDRSPAETADHPTLDEVFDRIVRTYDAKAEEVEVSFDPAYHYPLKVGVDCKRMATDESGPWRSQGLQPNIRPDSVGRPGKGFLR
jgi:hypothetical protein